MKLTKLIITMLSIFCMQNSMTMYNEDDVYTAMRNEWKDCCEILSEYVALPVYKKLMQPIPINEPFRLHVEAHQMLEVRNFLYLQPIQLFSLAIAANLFMQ